MQRGYYLNFAATGLRMPICTDLVLHDYQDANAIVEDGARLGQVITETAWRLHAPIAIPHMDLELEKLSLLALLGIPAEQAAQYHFTSPPTAEAFRLLAAPTIPFTSRLQAHIDSIAYIARHTDLLPVGMSIGPFSLATKLVGDPITPIALAGEGISAEDEEEIQTIEQVLELGSRFIMKSIAAQIDAGAKAIFIAEPAANKVYFSPNQLDAGSDIFDRFVMTYNRQVKALLEDRQVDLIFHCCGELTDYFVKKFVELDPAMLSLGSSRTLWEDAALVPDDIVLYGNLPSKQFYSDDLMSVAQVKEQSCRLERKMREAGHPFILGTECDVLSVPGREETIRRKVRAIMSCDRVSAGRR